MNQLGILNADGRLLFVQVRQQHDGIGMLFNAHNFRKGKEILAENLFLGSQFRLEMLKKFPCVPECHRPIKIGAGIKETVEEVKARLPFCGAVVKPMMGVDGKPCV